MKPSKGYTARVNKVEYLQLAGRIYGHTDRELERMLLPILRILWPALVRPEARSKLDTAGIDFYLGSPPRFDLVIQCKGSIKDEVTSKVVRSAAASSVKFRRSGLSSERYLLFTNKPVKGREIAASMGTVLDTLRESGSAFAAEHWDTRELLKQLFNHLVRRVIAHLRSVTGAAVREHLVLEPPLCADLIEVPCGRRLLAVDPQQIRTANELEAGLLDPAKLLFDSPRSNLSVLLGEYGYGKTICLIRGVADAARTVIFIPAARIPNETLNTKSLLMSCVNLDGFGQDYDGETRMEALRLTRGVLEYLFKRDKEPWALVIDGLDESAELNRPGRLRNLINALREIKIPVVLSARTEWWRVQESELRSRDPGSRKQEPIVRKWQVVNLEMWGYREVAAFAQRFASSRSEPASIQRILTFATLVQEGSYERFYGDIPRRPLFLRWILETLETDEIRPENRVSLFEHWLRLKLERDFGRPLDLGGAGRVGIASTEEKLLVRRRLARAAMEAAAGCMHEHVDDAILLRAECSFEKLRGMCPELADVIDPTGLVINSLLRAVRRKEEDYWMSFTHRAYQEYFLAQWLKSHHASADGYPPAVAEWLQLINEHETKAPLE